MKNLLKLPLLECNYFKSINIQLQLRYKIKFQCVKHQCIVDHSNPAKEHFDEPECWYEVLEETERW